MNVLPTDLASMWNGSESTARQSAVLGNVFKMLRRQYLTILICGGIGLLASIIYLAVAKPIYEATASVLMDTSQVYSINNAFGSTNFVTAEVMSSQMELVRSQRVASLVVADLDLELDPRFEQPESPVAAVRGFFVGALNFVGLRSSDPNSPLFNGEREPSSPAEAFSSAVADLRDMIIVNRVPLTYVVDIKFQSPYPELAADIANSVANSFLRHQVNATVEESARISEWLTASIEDARERSEEADLAVERYRAQNDLVSTGGTLLGETQLAEINLRLVDARAAAAQASAAYQQAAAVLEAKDPDAIAAALVGSDSARNLLARYDNAREHLADMEARLAPGHQQIGVARSNVEQIVGLLSEELARYVANLQRDRQLAESNAAELEQRLEEVSRSNSDANIRTIALRELERTAEIYRGLHQNLLVRQQEVLQNASVPTIGAEIINDAHVPDEPVSPNRGFSLIMFTLAGLVVGGTIAVLREVNDRSFRNGEQLARSTTLPFAGYFPNLSVAAPYSPRADQADQLNYVQMHPQSLAASTLRNVRVAVEMARTKGAGGQTVSITSSLKGEGKTTIAINLARHLASSGFKVIMVDLDMWNPALSRSLKISTTSALQDVIERRVPLAKAISKDTLSSAHILRSASRRVNLEKFFGSPQLKEQIDELKKSYDYVILDFPPLAIISDTNLLIRYSDMVVFAVTWGKTSRVLVERVLATALAADTNIVCTVLTMANPHRVKRFEEPDWEPRQYQYASYTDQQAKARTS